MRMRIVAHDLKVFKLIVVDTLWLTLEYQLRQLTGLASKLQLNLLNMIQINMSIAHGHHYFTHTQITLLSQHVSQETNASQIVGISEQ